MVGTVEEAESSPASTRVPNAPPTDLRKFLRFISTSVDQATSLSER
jgi:hypothetical protein